MKRSARKWIGTVKKPSRARRRGEAGYSLLEVLIVLTIIALIAALVGPRLMAQLDRSKVKAAQIQIETLATVLGEMRTHIQRYPTAQEGLGLLVSPPASEADRAVWQGPYLNTLPTDPWGREYVYEPESTGVARPRILSLGADNKEGGAGLDADISREVDP